MTQLTLLNGILFDLDGTLVDSLQATFDAFNHGFAAVGARAHSGEEIMAHFGPGEGEIFAKVVGAEKAAIAYEACLAYTDQNLGRVPLHAGVPEMLAAFRSAGIPMSIVTGRSWNTTEMILKHHGISADFVTVIANDHVGSPKPSPEGIELALSRMKLRPEETLYVGDSHVDVLAARRAGAGSVAALWDLLARRERLEPHGPHHWAERPSVVWEIFQARRKA